VTFASFIAKNALRNKRRAALSILSVAVSLFLLVFLMVALRLFTHPPESAGAELRVAVRNKISITQPLPARQRPLIEKIDGVKAVTPFSWFGGNFRDEQTTMFAQFAMDPKKLREIFTEMKMSDEGFAGFEAERTACVVGKLTADKYQLKIGDRMVLNSPLYPNPLEFKIAGIFTGTDDDKNVFFRQDYLEENSDIKGQVGMWWLKVRSAEDMPRVIAEINKTFENTSAAVRAETERAFQLGFMSMWGNISLLVGLVSSAVVFTLLLVTASTMSMAIRERMREMAILKALGYQRSMLFAFILAESFGLAALGALLGVGGGWCLFKYGDIPKMTNGFITRLEVPPETLGVALAVTAGLGILSSIMPGLSVMRTSVVQGLKTLD
jgi:putative ABC transport system permease protein